MTVKRDARGQDELRCPDLLPSRSLPAQLQRLAPAARQKKKSGSTPWVVGACGTRAQPPERPLVAVSCVEKQARALGWSSDSPAEHEERQRRLLERSVDEVEGLAPAITTATSVVCAL